MFPYPQGGHSNMVRESMFPCWICFLFTESQVEVSTGSPTGKLTQFKSCAAFGMPDHTICVVRWHSSVTLLFECSDSSDNFFSSCVWNIKSVSVTRRFFTAFLIPVELGVQEFSLFIHSFIYLLPCSIILSGWLWVLWHLKTLILGSIF